MLISSFRNESHSEEKAASLQRTPELRRLDRRLLQRTVPVPFEDQRTVGIRTVGVNRRLQLVPRSGLKVGVLQFICYTSLLRLVSVRLAATTPVCAAHI